MRGQFHLPAMNLRFQHLTHVVRLGLAWTLVLALVLAPTLMHSRASQAVGHQHYSEPVYPTHSHEHASHEGGKHVAPSDEAINAQEPDSSQIGGACFNCVICIGTIGVACSTAPPEFQRLAVHPEPTPVLVTLDPEPGVRPPLI